MNQKIGDTTIWHRKLGTTGLDVSMIGFGAWQIGGGRWHVGSREESIQLLRDAQKLGVNIYDSAVVYGQYKDSNRYLQSRSQELLGEAFQGMRDQVIFCLKLGQFDEYSHRSDFSPERIIDQFKQSVRRLRTNYVDLVLCHAPSLRTVREEKAIRILQSLRALGFVRAVGYSFENEPEHVRAALEQDIDVIMLQYNLLDEQCVKAIQEAEMRGIGILVGGPFKRGYLTGKFNTIKDLPLEDNYWKWNVNYNPGKVQHILKQVHALKEKHGSPRALRKAAIGHIVKESGVNSLIVGHRDIREVRENIESLRAIMQSLGVHHRRMRSKKER
jgi:myo-inositol catabolism protein IolS